MKIKKPKTIQGTIIIETKISEQELMESCLNMSASGLDTRLILFLYALKNRWHIEKLMYYQHLIETAEFHGEASCKGERD